MTGNPSNRQFRAARAYLGWTRKQAADRAGVSDAPIYTVESGNRGVSQNMIDQIRFTYEIQGIVFTSFDGIAKRP